MSETLVIDTSVFIAILAKEPDTDRLSAAIRGFPRRVMAATNYLECAMVADRWHDGRASLDTWLSDRSIEIASVDHRLAQYAADAFVRFGKGRHPAGLNFGDCFSYALAKSHHAPLLFKGNDFSQTDIVCALA